MHNNIQKNNRISLLIAELVNRNDAKYFEVVRTRIVSKISVITILQYINIFSTTDLKIILDTFWRNSEQ